MNLNIATKFGSKLNQTQRTKSMTMAIIITASIVVVFCLVASNVMISEARYQHRVLSGKNAAIAQLKADIIAINTLATQYQAFSTASTNAIGGSATGTGPNDGTNSQIVLDGLPSQYDFPGLTASIEKILTTRGVQLQSITGVDSSSLASSKPMADPQPITMTFSFSATSSYNGVKQVFSDFQKSIRPFHVVSIQLSGTDARMTVNAGINTYYQPAKTLSITSRKVQ